ncbi:RimK family alpha-L-glutamate ligase [Gracilibacillus caseinilyticus]|uniref:RimK family alpha-L-glutamate ligase n=1 Tax=Gracilibacillus caseinilyticus TaxID=2932256 RepID=A0ABY4EXB9_9BACI|nr:RimK family alpha-L-glutamate ligase [Gracilibacillus caseinilyticus]UOQ48898.1 RimK family alpha-L-glutamate ligase [Gracilibacillus caseinilyticus]
MRKKGWIIYNGNLYTTKFSEQVEWLKRTATAYNFDMEAIPNNQLLVTVENGQSKLLTEKTLPDFVFFWDKDLVLARQLEQLGVRLFNSARTIEISDDKALTTTALADHGIAMPKTIMAPKVFLQLEDDRHLQQVINSLGFPMILKECFGSFGEQVYFVEDEQSLRQKARELANKPFLFQEYLQSSYGRDIRLHVVGDKVVASMLRKAENDFRANVTAGGKMYPYEPTSLEKELAVTCSQLIGADFAGVDILFGEHDEPVICEINSNAHFKNIFDCTGIDITMDMMSYIKEQIG